jgi:hypothetical protein
MKKIFGLVFLCLILVMSGLLSACGGAGSISGKVLNGNSPVAGATVYLRAFGTESAEPDYETTTEADGSYSFVDLKPGDYNIIVDWNHVFLSTNCIIESGKETQMNLNYK